MAGHISECQDTSHMKYPHTRRHAMENAKELPLKDS